MKKIPALIVLLVISALSTLPALDIYVNNVLWHSYTDEALEALITEIPVEAPPSLPFALLLPLMEDTREMHLLFRAGDARLDCASPELRKARLVRKNGIWELNWDGSSYREPRRADIYGRRLGRRSLTIWAEPGLEGFEKQIRVWSRLHKLEMKYCEIENMEDELIHRRLTGETLPDLVLRFQSSREAFSEKETTAYLLRSILNPGGEYRHLVLPRGERFHPELFLSLLLSLEPPSESPVHPSFPVDGKSLNRARDIYLNLILNQKLIEKDSLHGTQGMIYYPARSFPRIPGDLSSLPSPDGRNILPPRVLPVQLKSFCGDVPAEALLDFLKLPGIQHSLVSPQARQLPGLTGIIEEKKPGSGETALYREWRRGYILSSETGEYIKKLEKVFPDLYRNNGVLP